MLVSIGAAFLSLSRQVDVQRRALATVLEPAARRIVHFQLSFLDELAQWRLYLLRPTDAGVAHMRAIHQRTKNSFDELSGKNGTVGRDFSKDLAPLRETFAAWEAIPVAVLGGQSLQAFLRFAPQQLARADSVMEASARLGDDVSQQMRQRVARLQQLEQRRLRVLAALFPLTLVGIILTAVFARRAAISHQRVVENAAQEALLRDAIAGLTGDQILPAALNRIATNAMRMCGADGAFIESSDDARRDIEIAAAVGTGAPPGGSHVGFIGSITDDLVRAGTTELSTELTNRETELGRGVGDDWRNCFAFAVPLQSDGDLDGALVLLRRDLPIEPRGETISRLKALGAWAALALRRQHLAAELASEHARLRAVIEEMPVGVFLAEAPSGRMAMFNRHAVDLWGSPATPPTSIEEYQHWHLFHPDGREYETRDRPLARSLRDGVVVQGEEAVVQRADGERRPVRINSAPIRDARGTIVAGVATADDISEEKRREHATRFLDEISRQLATSLDYEATMQAVLRLLAPRLGDIATIHHRQEDDTIVRKAGWGDDPRITELLGNLDRDYPLPLPSAHPISVAIRTGKAQLREVVDDELLRTVARDERQLDWLRALHIHSAMAVPLTARNKPIGALQLLSMDPIRRYTCEDLDLLEQIGGRVSLAIDNAQLFRSVNENARVSNFLLESALTLSGSLESEEVLRRLTTLAVPAFADMAIAYVKDERGHLRHVASAHRDASKQSMLDEAASLYHPDPANVQCTLIKALSTGQPVVAEHVTKELLDNHRFGSRTRELFEELAPTSWMTLPLVARDKALGVIVFASLDAEHRFGAKDVSLGTRIAVSAALAMQNATLFTTVQDALAMRDEVLGIVSHDLRNPLNMIGMSVQLLQELEPDEAERKRHLAIIGRARERMDRLIQDLLDVARVEAGKPLVIERRNARPSAIIREACELFVIPAREKRVQFEWFVPEELPSVSVDVGRIIQVLSNLVGNALKFTPEGGRVVVRATENEGMVQVSVEDSGPGISAEDLDRIFRPFWQARRHARSGAGLGLAIARGIVEQHGGHLWASSREGAGSTFSFALPTATLPQSRAA
ncbi:MAG TPA: ATP-binding protein [Gemmatimonadaceae bacterium]|nr:ATP-binding protein [Gemmatimonadaceae bacterium]